MKTRVGFALAAAIALAPCIADAQATVTQSFVFTVPLTIAGTNYSRGSTTVSPNSTPAPTQGLAAVQVTCAVGGSDLSYIGGTTTTPTPTGAWGSAKSEVTILPQDVRQTATVTVTATVPATSKGVSSASYECITWAIVRPGLKGFTGSAITGTVAFPNGAP